MITLTLEQLINSTEALRSLSQKPLKARCAYAVGKILRAADAEMTSFNETRKELIDKYGEKDEKGILKEDENGNVHIIMEKLNDFNTELQELLATTIEINANKISIDDIGEIEFTPAEITQLEDFIEFE